MFKFVNADNTNELIQYIQEDNRELLHVINKMDLSRGYISNFILDGGYYFINCIDWNQVYNKISSINNATSNCMLGMLCNDIRNYIQQGMIQVYHMDAYIRQNKTLVISNISTSIKYFTKSESLGCKYATYLLGYAYYISKKYNKAIEYFNKAIENGIYNAYKYLIEIYHETNEQDKVIDTVRIFSRKTKYYKDYIKDKTMIIKYLPSYVLKYENEIERLENEIERLNMIITHHEYKPPVGGEGYHKAKTSFENNV